MASIQKNILIIAPLFGVLFLVTADYQMLIPLLPTLGRELETSGSPHRSLGGTNMVLEKSFSSLRNTSLRVSLLFFDIFSQRNSHLFLLH